MVKILKLKDDQPRRKPHAELVTPPVFMAFGPSPLDDDDMPDQVIIGGHKLVRGPFGQLAGFVLGHGKDGAK